MYKVSYGKTLYVGSDYYTSSSPIMTDNSLTEASPNFTKNFISSVSQVQSNILKLMVKLRSLIKSSSTN